METKETKDERHTLAFRMAAGEPHVYVCETREGAIELAKRVENRKEEWVRINTPDLRGHAIHLPRQYLMGCEIFPYREAAKGTTAIVAGPPEPAKPEPEPEPIVRDADGARVIRATPIGGNGSATAAPAPVAAGAAEEE